MKRGMVYLAVMALTRYLAIIYNSRALLLLFYGELILPVGLLLEILALLFRVRVSLRIPVGVAVQGEGVPVYVQINYRGKIFTGGIVVKVIAENRYQKQKEKFSLRGIVCGNKNGKSQILADYRSDLPGEVDFRVKRIWIYDCLGIFCLPLPGKRQPASDSLMVLPEICEMPVHVSRACRDFAGESEPYSKEKSGQDPSELFQIREYQPGDKMRSIHWKLTAKTGDLMVKEQSLPLGCPVILYLDFLEQKGQRRRILRRKRKNLEREAFLKIASGISHSLLEERCRHYVVWYSEAEKDVFRYRVEKEEDFYGMLFALSRNSFYRTVRDLEDLYLHKYHENMYCTKLRLDAGLNLYRNEEEKVQYPVHSLEKVISQTELSV